MTKHIIAVLLCLLLTATWIVCASAAPQEEATDISENTSFLGNGYENFQFLVDKDIDTYQSSTGQCHFTLMNEKGIGSLYLMFDLEYGEYTIENAASKELITAGTHGMLHEYIDLTQTFGEAPTSVTLHFENGAVRLSEIYVFSEGTPPEHVQLWEPPLEGKTDILLLSTHGDDDQLFYAGLLPLYAGEKKVAVQVAYLTDHRNLTNARTHEILNGLWAVGCKAYPVIGDFPDFRIDDMKESYAEFDRLGHSEEKLMRFVVELLRRFKPQVTVGHDINGEYGHGMHMVYTDSLIKALEVSNDDSFLPELAQQYGIWEVPKVYLHLYPNNPITVDYDQPLSSFDGMTAFQVSQKLGYPCHKSQQYTWFTDWINGSNGEITKASQITRYNPCQFGLYQSHVGDDQNKNDFMENLVTYAEQERIEQERLEKERLEQEKLEQERLEQERQELERIEAEKQEQKRLEQERLEKERLEQQRQEQLQRKKERRILMISTGIGIAVIVIALIPTVYFLWKKSIPDDIDT